VGSTEHQRQIIDTFVNSVYVFDDRVVLNFNFTDDSKTISREEVLGSSAVDNAPPKTPQDDEFCGVFHCIFYFPASNTASTAFWTCSRFSASVNISSAWASKTAVEISSPR